MIAKFMEIINYCAIYRWCSNIRNDIASYHDSILANSQETKESRDFLEQFRDEASRCPEFDEEKTALMGQSTTDY